MSSHQKEKGGDLQNPPSHPTTIFISISNFYFYFLFFVFILSCSHVPWSFERVLGGWSQGEGRRLSHWGRPPTDRLCAQVRLALDCGQDDWGTWSAYFAVCGSSPTSTAVPEFLPVHWASFTESRSDLSRAGTRIRCCRWRGRRRGTGYETYAQYSLSNQGMLDIFPAFI